MKYSFNKNQKRFYAMQLQIYFKILSGNFDYKTRKITIVYLCIKWHF